MANNAASSLSHLDPLTRRTNSDKHAGVTSTLQKGPPSIRQWKTVTRGFVFVDLTTDDTEVTSKRPLNTSANPFNFPRGYYIQWAGQFEVSTKWHSIVLLFLFPITSSSSLFSFI